MADTGSSRTTIRTRRLAGMFALVFSVTACAVTRATVPNPRATGSVPIGDIRMYYEVHGEGPPLLLLHGGLGNSGNWERQVPALSTLYTVIALDSRGQGRTSYSDRPISYSLMSSDVVAMMDFLNIERAYVLGWSDGAVIGLDLAINHPERLIKLIAFGANFSPAGMREDALESEAMGRFFEQAAADYQALSPNAQQWDALLANLSNMWASEPMFTAEQLGRITVPVLILDGDNDEAIYTGHTRELAGLIPTATLRLLRGTGHFAPREKPEEFNEVALDFLRQ